MRQPLAPPRGLSLSPLAGMAALLCAGLLAMPLSARAGWVSAAGQHMPDRPDRRSDGTLGAMLVLTLDGEALRRAWAGPTPPRLDTTDKARRGEKITASVLYHGCQANAQGVCDLAVRYSVVAPDGHVTPAGGGPLGDRPHPPGRVQLGQASLVAAFEQHEPTGLYRIRALVIDRVARRQLSLTAPLTLLP